MRRNGEVELSLLDSPSYTKGVEKRRSIPLVVSDAELLQYILTPQEASSLEYFQFQQLLHNPIIEGGILMLLLNVLYLESVKK